VTNAELAILSLVAEQPRHGYEIEQIIEERGMRDWTELGFSSIYYLLKKLEQQGLIESALEVAARGPARKVYHITSEGQAAFQTAALAVLSEPQQVCSPFILGLSNLMALPPAQILAALEHYQQALNERLAHVRQRKIQAGMLPPLVMPVFDYSLAMIESELQWIGAFIEQFKASTQSGSQKE